MEFIIANWWWLSLCIPTVLGALKVAAKMTKWTGDDKIVTLLAGIWAIYKDKPPKVTTGKLKEKNVSSVEKATRYVERKYRLGGEELEE